MANLIDTLGKKESASTADGTGNPATTSTPKVEVSETKPAATGSASTAGVDDSKGPSSSSKEEPKGTGTDVNSWTIENALKEIKKLREENKSTRINYQESVENLKKEMETRISSREKELEEYRNAQKELTELKDKEADKKRDLAEKVAHREALAAELKAKLEATERQKQAEIDNLKSTVEQFKAEKEAQRAVQQKRLDEELATIPDKFKSVASLLVKGAGGDPSDALLALNEAKISGLFEDKTIVVNHSVPGANDGARTTKEKLDLADKERRAKLTSMQKIGQALKDMKQQPNTAFRTNKS